jgi:type IV secretion system protein TrbL
MLSASAARLAGRAAGGTLAAAAAVSGRIGAAYEIGGARGVARTALAAPTTRALTAASSPLRDAHREGAAQGYRDAAPPSDGGAPPTAMPPMSPLGGAPPNAPPAWAQSLGRRQQTTQAALLAAQALREGDRPAGGSNPDLKDKS